MKQRLRKILFWATLLILMAGAIAAAASAEIYKWVDEGG